MAWYKILALCLGGYLLPYLIIVIYNRSNDIRMNRRTNAQETYAAPLIWPLVVLFYIPYYIVEGPSQLLAKYFNYRDNVARRKKFGSTITADKKAI